MIPSTFAYERASSLDDALMQLQNDNEAKLLAGGHSLLPLMKMRLAQPGKLIDLSGVAELHGIEQDGNQIAIGALTTHAQVARSPLVQRQLPALAEAAGQIGDLQVRNRGTVGGNLAHADPASDLPALALAYDAEIEVATKDGRERLPVADFFLGPLLTALPEGAVITRVLFQIPPQGARSRYLKFAHPASGYAVVGVAAVGAVGAEGTVTNVRVAVTGAADFAYRAAAVEAALEGHHPDAETIESAAKHAVDDGEMAGDLFASAEYRAHLVHVYTARALHQVFAG